MIQVHTVESIETAIALGCLIPHDAPPKSRHRFWIGDYRVDAYLNRDKKLFVHWLHRPTGDWKHPRPDGCYRITHSKHGTMRCYYRNGYGPEDIFRPSSAPPGPGEGKVGEEV